MKNGVIKLKDVKNLEKVGDCNNCNNLSAVEIDVCFNKKHLEFYFCKRHFEKIEKEIIGGEIKHE